MTGRADEPVADGTQGAVLSIDRAALNANWRTLAAMAGSARTGAVVKGDGYGLGIETVVPVFYEAGCRDFFVAHLSEAVRVRALTDDATIYVLNGFLPGTGPHYRAHQLTPVLGGRAEIEEWAGFAAGQDGVSPAALHIDTGMNRHGISLAEAGEIARINAEGRLGFALGLVMSHFVEAERAGSPMTARQCADFAAIRRLFPDVPASLCNSSGTFFPPEHHYDLVRPGYALYGGHPFWSSEDGPMQPVIRLAASIIQTRIIASGETVGYGGLWTASRPSLIATLSIGYADGYPRGAEGTMAAQKAHVLVGGTLCPVIGRISMDLLAVDVTDAPEGSVTRGGFATIIGDALTIDRVGAAAGTIGYDILVSLGRRFVRHTHP